MSNLLHLAREFRAARSSLGRWLCAQILLEAATPLGLALQTGPDTDRARKLCDLLGV